MFLLQSHRYTRFNSMWKYSRICDHWIAGSVFWLCLISLGLNTLLILTFNRERCLQTVLLRSFASVFVFVFVFCCLYARTYHDDDDDGNIIIILEFGSSLLSLCSTHRYLTLSLCLCVCVCLHVYLYLYVYENDCYSSRREKDSIRFLRITCIAERSIHICTLKCQIKCSTPSTDIHWHASLPYVFKERRMFEQKRLRNQVFFNRLWYVGSLRVGSNKRIRQPQRLHNTICNKNGVLLTAYLFYNSDLLNVWYGIRCFLYGCASRFFFVCSVSLCLCCLLFHFFMIVLVLRIFAMRVHSAAHQLNGNNMHTLATTKKVYQNRIRLHTTDNRFSVFVRRSHVEYLHKCEWFFSQFRSVFVCCLSDIEDPKPIGQCVSTDRS